MVCQELEKKTFLFFMQQLNKLVNFSVAAKNSPCYFVLK